ncbi:MAG: hypothetical protein Tsb0014_00290 [Pleurocapsa sp.]
MIKLRTNQINNWIFVTGLIRSGTTFVGKILSLPLQVDYIHEPFSCYVGMPGMTKVNPYVRPSLDTEEMQHFDVLTQSIFNYDLTLPNIIPSKDALSRRILKHIVGSRGPFYLRLAKLNAFHKAAVIKDPMGKLLSEYLYLRFNVKPVIVIKHPTSYIASLKRVNWWPDLSTLAVQPELVRDYFTDEVDFLNQNFDNCILEAAAVWRAMYKVLLSQANKYSDWQIITHEELCTSPVTVFKEIYHRCELPWSKSIENKIIRLTQSKSTEAKKGLVQDFNRNSADIFKMRRDSLSLKERRQIFDIVQDVALQIYPRESFDIN